MITFVFGKSEKYVSYILHLAIGFVSRHPAALGLLDFHVLLHGGSTPL